MQKRGMKQYQKIWVLMGLCSLLAWWMPGPANAATNLVLNGSFELMTSSIDEYGYALTPYPADADCRGSYVRYGWPNNWSVTYQGNPFAVTAWQSGWNNCITDFVNGPNTSLYASDGQFLMIAGYAIPTSATEYGNALGLLALTFSQVVSGVASGSQYQLSIDVGKPIDSGTTGSTDSAGIALFWGGLLLDQITPPRRSDHTLTHYTYTVTGGVGTMPNEIKIITGCNGYVSNAGCNRAQAVHTDYGGSVVWFDNITLVGLSANNCPSVNESSNADILVNGDGSSGTTKKAVLAIISHGRNGHGAFPSNGSTIAKRINVGSTDVNELDNANVTAGFALNFDNSVQNRQPSPTYDDIVLTSSRCK